MLFGKKRRIILRLARVMPNKTPGPMDHSVASFVKLSGRSGVDPTFVQALRETVAAKIWAVTEEDTLEDEKSAAPSKRVLRTGIMGIERKLAEKQKQTDDNISLAFKDLSQLMEMAKDMVAISKVVSAKIRDRQGDISEDETVRFKSYLMSLGIDDPVTRDGTRSNSEYFMKLSQQLCEMLLDPITVDLFGFFA